MQSSIFSGQVSHARKTPLKHAFRYGVYMAFLDLDELGEVFKGRWLWSTRRMALVRFRRKDYLGDPDVSLDQAVRELVEERTGSRPQGPIRLLTNLTWFGYCFNPISVYYCYEKDGRTLDTIVAEVNNTPWGERSCYVLTREMNVGDDVTRRFRTDKAMHVSPFMSMDVSYDWLVTAPTDDLVLRISTRADNARFFNATLALKRQEITGINLAMTLIRYPLMTFKVITGIYWQAFRLWIRGCPVHTHPEKAIQAKT